MPSIFSSTKKSTSDWTEAAGMWRSFDNSSMETFPRFLTRSRRSSAAVRRGLEVGVVMSAFSSTGFKIFVHQGGVVTFGSEFLWRAAQRRGVRRDVLIKGVAEVQLEEGRRKPPADDVVEVRGVHRAHAELFVGVRLLLVAGRDA